MSETNQVQRSEVVLGSTPEGSEVPSRHHRVAAIGPYTGDAPTHYGTRAITNVGKGQIRDAVAEIGPELHNVVIQHPLTKEEMTIPRLAFTSDPADWDADIIRSVPLLKLLLTLDRLIENALADEREQKAMDALLLDHPVVGDAYRAVKSRAEY